MNETIESAASYISVRCWIFFAHQVGAALGAAVGGWVFDATGAYTWAFVSAAVLAFVASAMALAIREEPARPRPGRQPVRVAAPAA